MRMGQTIVIMAILGGALAQTGPQATDNTLLQRARNGDDSALSEMEKSGDANDLRVLLHDEHYAGKPAARLALARMGDRDVLQFYACKSLTDDVDKMQLLIRDDFDHIGGAFTIEVYRQLLDSDSRFLPKIEKNKSSKYSDVVVTMPSSRVLLSLPKLVPNPPITKPKFVGDSSRDHIYKSVWKTWIKSHADEIKKLPPSPEGISFDPKVCSAFAKKNPAAQPK